LPTLVELAGVKLLHEDIDGKSLVNVIRDEKASTPHAVTHWQVGRGKKAQWAVRQGDWKLIGNPRDTSNKGKLGKDDNLFLVNLVQDVSEMKNLAAAHTEKLQELKKLHEDWVRQAER